MIGPLLTAQIGFVVLLLIIFVLALLNERKKKKEAIQNVRLESYWDGEERRRAVRIDVSIGVKYEVAGNPRDTRKSLSRNISMVGINLKLYEKLYEGKLLKLEMEIPSYPKSVLATGEVVWVKEIPASPEEIEKRVFATGIKFTHIDLRGQTALLNYINNYTDAQKT